MGIKRQINFKKEIKWDKYRKKQIYAQTMRKRSIKDLPTQMSILTLVPFTTLLLKILKPCYIFTRIGTNSDIISKHLPCESYELVV